MKLSVLIITYNQEAFIRETLESVLAQKTNFDFEIVVCEDCSKDSTAAIVRSFEMEHPAKIRAIYRPKNLGMFENFIQGYRACRGQYIAILEGDDYWIDDEKLQKQVNLLDRNPHFSMCFHNTVARTGSADIASMKRLCPPDQKPVSHFLELLAENFVQTCSVLWRNLGNDVAFPDGIHQLKIGDWPIHLMHAHRGPIGYLPDIMAVYRISPGGVWSQLDHETCLLALIDVYQVVDRYFGMQYSRIITRLVNYYHLELSHLRTSTEALRLQAKEKELVEVIEERNVTKIQLHATRNELVRLQQAMNELVASRAVRLGTFMSKLAGYPGRIPAALARVLRVGNRNLRNGQ